MATALRQGLLLLTHGMQSGSMRVAMRMLQLPGLAACVC
jgi:hypothetical protein